MEEVHVVLDIILKVLAVIALLSVVALTVVIGLAVRRISQIVEGVRLSVERKIHFSREIGDSLSTMIKSKLEFAVISKILNIVRSRF